MARLAASFRQHAVYAAKHQCGWNSVKAVQISAHTRLVAVNRTRTAHHVKLHCVFTALVPSHKSAIRMRGTPDAYHAQTDKRSKMHIGRVHGQHKVAMPQQCQLHRYAETQFRHIDQVLSVTVAPSRYGRTLAVPGTEQEQSVSVPGCQRGNYLFHEAQRIYLAGMHGKRRYSYPRLTVFFRRCGGGIDFRRWLRAFKKMTEHVIT